MARKEIYYCSVCKQKLENPKGVVCGKCHKPTVPVTADGLRERIYRLSPEQKITLHKHATLYIICGMICGMFSLILTSSLLLTSPIAGLFGLIPIGVTVWLLALGIGLDKGRAWAIKLYADMHRHRRPHTYDEIYARQFDGMTEAMESEYSKNEEKLDSAKMDELLKTHWFCKKCGYMNDKADPECKSCGHWK